MVRILNKVVDQANFLTGDSAISAYGTRAIGIGIQGLADVFAKREVAFVSTEAREVNVHISETIYHASLESSCELAERDGPYDMWQGSPASQGVLQIDMWAASTTDRYDFAALRSRISVFGLRNSMLTAQMPIAATAQLLRNSEGIEPFTRQVPHAALTAAYCNLTLRPATSYNIVFSAGLSMNCPTISSNLSQSEACGLSKSVTTFWLLTVVVSSCSRTIHSN